MTLSAHMLEQSAGIPKKKAGIFSVGLRLVDEVVPGAKIRALLLLTVLPSFNREVFISNLEESGITSSEAGNYFI